MKKTLIPFICSLCLLFGKAGAVSIEKELAYDQYTLNDTYTYGKKERQFQWNKISQKLDTLEARQKYHSWWGILQNYQNRKGQAAPVKDYKEDEYGITDPYGVERDQSVPLYDLADLRTPARYGRDGSLIMVKDSTNGFFRVVVAAFPGEWMVPAKYIKILDSVTSISKIIVVDRANQNITTLEKTGYMWKIRSMNPATTGLRHPPDMRSTPLGIFVIQEQRAKMFFYEDGTTEIGGFSPHASRFSNGAYIHGVPVNLPGKEPIEYSWTLGTTPRSHMCVRNASSHAKFIYDWAIPEKTIIFVIE